MTEQSDKEELGGTASIGLGGPTSTEFKRAGGLRSGPGTPHEEQWAQRESKRVKVKSPDSRDSPRWTQWDPSMHWSYWTSRSYNSDWATNTEETRPRRIACKTEREIWDYQGWREGHGNRTSYTDFYGYGKTKTEDEWYQERNAEGRDWYGQTGKAEHRRYSTPHFF